MLADKPNIFQASGRLADGIHPRFTSKLELLKFIAEQLPHWRDHPDRPIAQAETTLTEYLCDYLDDAAYYSNDWNHIKFRTEIRDEVAGSRKIDLTMKPRGNLMVEGRRHTCFDALFPIECKRLPTPKDSKRDEREYVITSPPHTTGGMQRFKLGLHGAAHNFAAMIAYVQENTLSHWQNQVNQWIYELSAKPDSIWTDSDALELQTDNLQSGTSALKSCHKRKGLAEEAEEIELHHIWIKM